MYEIDLHKRLQRAYARGQECYRNGVFILDRRRMAERFYSDPREQRMFVAGYTDEELASLHRTRYGHGGGRDHG